MDATLSTLDDAVLSVVNQVLELLEDSKNLEKEMGVKINATDIASFLQWVAMPYICLIKQYF